MRFTIQQALNISESERLAGRVPRLALFGPPGSGKTDYLLELHKALREKRWVDYADCRLIDLRQLPVGSSDDIFLRINTDLLRAARQLKIPMRGGARMAAQHQIFDSILSEWLGSSPRHLILFIDHLDSAPRHFVNDLRDYLRQFFEREDFHPVGGKGRNRGHAQLGLVIAGSASLYELRQDPKSPIRHCDPIILPQQEMRVCRRLVKERLVRVRGWERSEEAVSYLAKATGGEPVFLNPLLEKMEGAGAAADNGSVKGRLEQLSAGLYGSESYSSTFWHLALHMWLDRELKEKVESLFDDDDDDVRPSVQDIDVDLSHLSGVLVVEGRAGRGNYPRYRLRNPIVASFLKDIIENEKASPPKPHIRPIIKKWRELEQAMTDCVNSETLWEAVTFLKTAWALVTPYSSKEDAAVTLYVSSDDGAWGWWMDIRNHKVIGPEKRIASAPAEDAVRMAVYNAAKGQANTPRDARAFVGWNDKYLSLAVIISRSPSVYVVTTLPRGRAGTEFTEYNLNHWVRFLHRKQVKTSLLNLTLAQLGGHYISKASQPKTVALASTPGRTEHVYMGDTGVVWVGGTRVDHYPGEIKAEDLLFLKSPPRSLAGLESPEDVFYGLRNTLAYRLKESLNNIKDFAQHLERVTRPDRMVIVSDTEGLKLPLELYPLGTSFLGLRLPVARQLYGFDPEPELCTTFPQLIDSLRDNKPLQVLLIGSNPYRDLPGVEEEIEKVKEIITRGCVGLEITPNFEVIEPGEATRERIGGYLWSMKSTTHILHYVGHGGASVGGAQGGLCLERRPDGVDVVGPQELTMMLRTANAKIWFAFINACAGARFSGAGPEAKGVGEALLDAGVPNFLGYREPISDVSAKFFAERFYEKLFCSPRGEPTPELGDAVMVARNAASAKHKHADAWLSSILLTMGV